MYHHILSLCHHHDTTHTDRTCACPPDAGNSSDLSPRRKGQDVGSKRVQTYHEKQCMRTRPFFPPPDALTQFIYSQRTSVVAFVAPWCGVSCPTFPSPAQSSVQTALVSIANKWLRNTAKRLVTSARWYPFTPSTVMLNPTSHSARPR